MQSVVALGFFPSFNPKTINQIVPPPTNILIPCSGSSIVQSSCTTLPLQKPAITSNVQSINESLNSGMMIIDDTSEKEQQMLYDVRRIQPIQQSTLIKLDLMDKPAQIFNCDETGFSDITQRKHVIVTSSTRYVFEKHGGSGKQYTTALIAISTAGHVISPFIIYSGKVLMNTWCKGGSDGSRYAVTKKGWINSCSFEYWLREMFIPATQHLNRSLLLVMDGHNAHMNINIIQLMKQHNIVCLILPPHCIWPFNENAMMQSVVAPGFSPSFDPRIINQILPSPTNILIPCSGSSIVQSSYTILPLQKPVTTSNVQSINESLNSGMMIIDHTSEKEQQMLCDVRRIQPIQQVFTDDHEIPSSDSTYTPLNMVDLNSSTFEPQSNFILQPTTQQNSQFMPMSLKEQNEQKQNKKPIVEAIHAVREVLVTLLEEQQQQQTTTASATTSRAS
ncbi:unnamed protein product [Rotaria sp. Silwood1]|nr:unnamed protein product [Rotaria sp. Silwood1]